ncbi:MAG: PAC2 family protein [Planctomycetota bacterium]|nr:PAC2 family protein [Planctomycetota bacterium]
MANGNELREPWLISAWPGMGNVAAGAGSYLVAKLGAKLVFEMPSSEFFDVQTIEVKDGLARSGRLPRSLIFEWRNPKNNHDILIFLGEGQPQHNGYAFCHRLLDYAMQRGVKRVFTFAAMATQLHPSSTPRVFSVATENDELHEMKKLGAEPLQEGQISGLNGVLLAACAERNLPGVCLLGELPFFAAGVPNPRASMAVLETFTKLAGIDLDFEEIQQQAETVQQGLLQLLEKMKETAQKQADEEGMNIPEPEENGEDDNEQDKTERSEPDDATRLRIEHLFEMALEDRAHAFRLKQELDRLKIFEHYENRFLDLFKKGE